MKMFGGALVLVVGCGAPVTAADSQPKTAVRCQTQEECTSAYEQASARLKACILKLPYGGKSCAQEEREKADATQAMQKDRAARSDAAWGARRAETAKHDAAVQTYTADNQKTGDACADVAALNAAADAAPYPDVANDYRRSADSRRDKALASVRMRTRAPMRNWTDSDDGFPTDARRTIASARDVAESARCYDAAAADAAKAAVDAWAGPIEARITAEEACRASPDCMGKRAAKPVCDLIAERREMVVGIATERRNPAGVVNLTALHDMGERIQIIDSELPERKKAYADAAKKPFVATICSQK